MLHWGDQGTGHRRIAFRRHWTALSALGGDPVTWIAFDSFNRLKEQFGETVLRTLAQCYDYPTRRMRKHLLRAWLTGLAIALILVALSIITAHTPLGIVVFYLTGPMYPALVILGLQTKGHEAVATTVYIYTSMVLFGSLFYGVLVLVVSGLRKRYKSRAH